AGVADLRDRLLLLPTRQAGRRLREALAWEMDRRGGALFPPMTATPWNLVRPGEGTATELACLWFWNRVLADANLKSYKHLFPRPPEMADSTWRRQMARSLHDLRGELAEGGLDCAAVAEGEDCPEAARWRDLKKLEAAYRKALGGQLDLHDAKRQAAAAPVLREGIQRVAVLGVPDLPVLVQQALENLAADCVPVEVVVFGPKKGDALFDEFGRPRPEQWANRELPLVDVQMISKLDEAAQAAEVSVRLQAYGENRARHVAVGVADPGVTPRLERALADAGVPCFNPDGRPLRRAPMGAFLRALEAVLRQPSFSHADALLRLPDAWSWAVKVLEKFSPTRMLRGLDELRVQHLPTRLGDATRLHFEGKHTAHRIHARAALEQLKKALGRIEKTPLSEGLVEFLQAAFGERNFTEGREADAADLESARLFMERLGEWEAALGPGKRPAAAEALTLLLDAVEREAVFPERAAEAVDIQGWLELAWEDAPHLIVAGVNEGHLPESIRGDRFLPDKLREQLGLRTNADRFARDAWLIELLLISRAENGRVDFLVGRQRASGEPLKPSRLLFRCVDKELPARVERLFAQLPPGPQPPAWSSAWRLKPGEVQSVERLGVTSISNYLACPYRFYLRHVLKMESLDLDLRELDARGFGSLVHHVLDAFGQDEKARALRDADAIQKFFTAELHRQMEQEFGLHPPLALRVQGEIAERRLHHAAHVQAAERAEGWEIIGSEDKFEKTLDGLLISGRIDRIERNAKTGAVRVLDYKTSTKATPPAKAHWQKFKPVRDAAVRDYAQFDLHDKPHHWLNLQLPLYAWALEKDYGTDLVAGYFNLPALGTDSGVALLEPFDRDLRAAAMDCASGVVADVRTERFWPPAASVKYDDFEGILFSQPEATALPPGEVAA
ncbi:MAG: PD-(D/E)XK nuclease family protein, partial [Myxococcota bacterium]